MKTLRRYWRIIFPIFFVILIWHFSAMNGENSYKESAEVASFLGITDNVARQLAHFLLFGALGYSISSFVKGLHPNSFPNTTLVLYPIIVTVAYGAIDEVHKLTIIGRDATVGDVFIDSIAGIMGTLIYVAIFCFWRNFAMKRRIGQYAKRNNVIEQ